MAAVNPSHSVSRLGRNCGVCQADTWLGLPIPLVDRSMLSDGGVLLQPLKKCTCLNCGLVQHVDQLPDITVRNYFGASYVLGDHQPNGGFEEGRQRLYANWIVDSLEKFAPRSILELGCGNGSLLKELMIKFPSAEAMGFESSERGVKWAQRSGLPVYQAYIVDETSVQGHQADLVVSVNVLEHTPDPVKFLRAAKAAVSEDGYVLIVCPDGAQVGSELLFFDHLHSFCPRNLVALVRSVGLLPISHHQSSSALPGFQLIIARREDSKSCKVQEEVGLCAVDVLALQSQRSTYLTAWKELDGELSGAMAEYKTTMVFGIGEMARLFRAYAPASWEQITSFVVDNPVEGEFFGRPVISYTEVVPSSARLMLLAVAKHSVMTLVARFKADGHTAFAPRVLEVP